MNRVTDTCIPEDTAIRRIEKEVLELWQKADHEKKRYFPYEYMYQLLDGGLMRPFLRNRSQRQLADRRKRKKPPDIHSGLGRFNLGQYLCFPCHPAISALIKSSNPELEQMALLVDWYKKTDESSPSAFSRSAAGLRATFLFASSP